MDKFSRYFRTELKRAAALLPRLFVFSFFSIAGLLLLGLLAVAAADSGEGKRKINIGVVGNAEDTYLGFGIGVLENMDASRFSINFLEYEEAEARAALQRGELTGYIIVPEDFVEALDRGEHKTILYVSASQPGSLSDRVMREIADMAVTVIQESERGIYAMQSCVLESGREGLLADATRELNLIYITAVLGRSKLYRRVITGEFQGLTPLQYYAGGMLILFMLLFGVSGSALRAARDNALFRMLSAGGISAPLQIAGEYLALFLLMLGFLASGFVASGFFMGFLGISAYTALGIGLPALFTAGLPAAAALSAMYLLLYELVSDTLTALMSALLCAMGMAYLAGCFYPTAFFPAGVRQISGLLPAGAGLRCLHVRMMGGYGAGEAQNLTVLFVYTAGLLLLTAAVRKRRIESDAWS